jgi:hypothetical protein
VKRVFASTWFWFALPIVVVSAVVLFVRGGGAGAPDDPAAVFRYTNF